MREGPLLGLHQGSDTSWMCGGAAARGCGSRSRHAGCLPRGEVRWTRDPGVKWCGRSRIAVSPGDCVPPAHVPRPRCRVGDKSWHPRAIPRLDVEVPRTRRPALTVPVSTTFLALLLQLRGCSGEDRRTQRILDRWAGERPTPPKSGSLCNMIVCHPRSSVAPGGTLHGNRAFLVRAGCDDRWHYHCIA